MCLPFSNGKIWDICFPVFRIWKQKTRTVLLRSGLYLEKWSTLMSEIFNLSDLRYFICHLSEREEHWTLCTKRQTLDEPKPEWSKVLSSESEAINWKSGKFTDRRSVLPGKRKETILNNRLLRNAVKKRFKDRYKETYPNGVNKKTWRKRTKP